MKTIETLFDKDITIYYPLKCNGKYEVIPYSFIGSLMSYSMPEDALDFMKKSFLSEAECKKFCEIKNALDEGKSLRLTL